MKRGCPPGCPLARRDQPAARQDQVGEIVRAHQGFEWGAVPIAAQGFIVVDAQQVIGGAVGDHRGQGRFQGASGLDEIHVGRKPPRQGRGFVGGIGVHQNHDFVGEPAIPDGFKAAFDTSGAVLAQHHYAQAAGQGIILVPPAIGCAVPCDGFARERPHGQGELNLIFQAVYRGVVAGPFHPRPAGPRPGTGDCPTNLSGWR